jgi:hypothetical protein
MKNRIASILSIGFTTFAAANAEEIVSGVIHNYDQANLGFSFIANPVSGSNANGYGFTTGASSEIAKNLLVSLKGESLWGKDDNLGSGNMWSTTPSVGLILRFAENHVNLIPHVDYSYMEMSLASYDGSVHGIAGGATLSLAKNDRFAIALDYTFKDTISQDMRTFYRPAFHSITLGPTIRLTDKIGVYIKGNLELLAEQDLVAEKDPYRIMIGFEYHW